MWDRFDDAMRDLDRDEHEWKGEIAALEAKIRKLGIEPPPWTRPDFNGAHPEWGDAPHGTYLDRCDEVEATRQRVRELEALLSRSQAKTGPGA